MINISLNTKNVYTTQVFDWLRVETDREHVDVQLAVGGVAMFNSRYYPVNEVATIYDLRSIIEHYLEVHELMSTEIAITAWHGNERLDEQTKTFEVIYCRNNRPSNIASDILSSFLTQAQARRIPTDTMLPLSRLAMDGQDLIPKISIDYRVSDSLRHDTRDLSWHDFDNDVNRTYTEFISTRYILQHFCVSDDFEEPELLAIEFLCQERSTAFYIDHRLDDGLMFYFRNCYNAVDGVAVRGIVTETLDVETQEANTPMRTSLYDRRAVKSFEVETDALTVDELRLIEDLFMSHDVRVPQSSGDTFEDMTSVIITASECKHSHGGDEPPTVKFTFRYTDRKPVNASTDGKHRFTAPYNNTFD